MFYCPGGGETEGRKQQKGEWQGIPGLVIIYLSDNGARDTAPSEDWKEGESCWLRENCRRDIFRENFVEFVLWIKNLNFHYQSNKEIVEIL